MKQDIVIAFVILHYKNMKDTLECIDSIRKLSLSDSYHIVVVDNDSCTLEEAKVLQEKADDFVQAQENLGFAKGNNLGIEKAKEYSPSFIAVINNDTVIEQDDFVNRIKKDYQKYRFDALGPKIITNGGESVNPFPAYKTKKQVEKAIRKSKQLISIYRSKCKRFLLRVYIRLKHILKLPKPLENGKCFQEDVSLHGCAIIFSRKYYKKYHDCFYQGTFLYHEEEFLELRRTKDRLKFIYDPKLEIFHKEGSSLNYSYNDNLYHKLIFREENILKSLQLLKKLMEEKEG